MNTTISFQSNIKELDETIVTLKRLKEDDTNNNILLVTEKPTNIKENA